MALDPSSNSCRKVKRPRAVVLCITLLLSCVIIGYVYNFRASEYISISSLINFRGATDSSSLNLGGGTASPENVDACNFPEVDPFDPAIMPFIKTRPTISCKGGDTHLVYLSRNTIKVNRSKVALLNRKNKFKECKYKSVAKKLDTDFNTVVLSISSPFNDSINLREKDEHIVVECYDTNNTVFSYSYFSLIRVKKDLELLLQENYKKHMDINHPKEILNILIMCIDATSKQNFQRHMPKTRNFFLDVLNATELLKYNNAGDNTYVNLVPILTGKYTYEFEGYDGPWKEPLDMINYAFLWSDFHRAGYRTALLLDEYYISAFHYLKKGWYKPPVDYYHRPQIIEREHTKSKRNENHLCVGDIPEITLNYDYLIQLASTFNNTDTPYFGFSSSSRLTHDDVNMASAGDDLYLSFLQELRDKNIINNTVILFFSDHGARYGPIRSTYNGLIESKTPLFFLVFPPWFHQKYPDLMRVLNINHDRLTTNVDIHATLQDLLNFQAAIRPGSIHSRGISLFSEIPRERTCKHAGIPDDTCVCGRLLDSNITRDLALAFSSALYNKLNSLRKNYRKECSELRVKNFRSSMKVLQDSPAEKDNSDTKSVYKVTFVTLPGDGLYEATLSIPVSTKMVEVVGDISRINMYRGQAECINDAKIRPYCFCRHI